MDPEEQGQDSEIQVEENSPTEEQLPADDAPQHEGGYNPAFEPIRQKLGLQFETIKDDLLEVEKGFNSGITKANSKYAPWKALEDQGLTPDSINQGFGLLRQLNDEPEKIYTALHDFLKQNGRLPQTDAEVQEVIDDAEDDDPEDRISKLFEEREAQLTQQMEQFQMQQMQVKAEQDVAREYADFEKAHPELTDEDRQEIYLRHYQYAASGPQNIRSLEDVAKEYTEFVNRIRSAPRPNDSAPRLPGAGGRDPEGGQRRQGEQVPA